LAVGEEDALDYHNIVDAYIVGVEVAGRWAGVSTPTHYERGWHPTATLGIFGAAAAAARLLRLDVATTQTALGIAASMAAGIKGNFGTFMKSGQVARAASNGTAAAYLAQWYKRVSARSRRSSIILRGLPTARSRRDRLVANVHVRQTWFIVDPGLVFKLYPCWRQHSRSDRRHAVRGSGE